MLTKADRKKGTPLRRAVRWWSEAPGIALRLLVVTVVMIVTGLMFSALQMLSTVWLRWAISLLIAAGMAAFYYAEGVGKGSRDAGNSRQLDRLERGGQAIDARDDASCYNPLKALAACALVFAVPLACAAYLALTGEAYTYALQDLPAWLTGSYGAREDVMAPLTAYTQAAGLAPSDGVRVFVRLFVLIFVNLFTDPLRMSLTIDRIAPLCMLIYPAAFMIGYLRGPAADARLEKQNRRAKKAAVRKQKRSSLAAELVGESNTPHYGHKRDSDKPKKKELI